MIFKLTTTNNIDMLLYLSRRWSCIATKNYLRYSIDRHLSNNSILNLNRKVDVINQLLDVKDNDVSKVLTTEQEKAIEYAQKGLSIFIHLSTGAGKSLAFQAPAILAPSGQVTLVVSPLLSLMQDQVMGLKRLGVNAIQISSKVCKDVRKKDMSIHDFLSPYTLVYTTPEFITKNEEMHIYIQHLVRYNKLHRLVIDEAHCVLEWGTTFRPSYIDLVKLRNFSFPEIPVTLASATISQTHIAQMASIFQLNIVKDVEISGTTNLSSQLVVVQHISDRKNLRIEVHRKMSHLHSIVKLIGSAPTIIYCLTKKEADSVWESIVKLGCQAGVYHSGLPLRKREFVQKQWMTGQISAICATSAFGMGINRPDVRFVIHHTMPLTLSSYTQQIGRAGRDNKPSVCLLLYEPEDYKRAVFLNESTDEYQLTSRLSYREIEEMAHFCTTNGCRKAIMFAYFGYEFDTSKCGNNCNCNCSKNATALDNLEIDFEKFEEEESKKKTQYVNSEEQKLKSKVEYLYHTIQNEVKRLKLPKREGLSRQVIKTILQFEQITMEEMESLKSVGSMKAERFYHIFPNTIK